MSRETHYDTIFDAQKHFRVLLDVMAKPGKIAYLERPHVRPPGKLYPATGLIAFALFNSDCSFAFVGNFPGESEYIQVNTGAPMALLEEADFVLFPQPGRYYDRLPEVKTGIPEYPDQSATLLIQVDQLSKTPIPGGLTLHLEGPGIDGHTQVSVAGILPEWLEAIRQANKAYPLGIDVFWIDRHQGICGLPRTTRFNWETN